jgi:5'-nucleotidase
VPAAQILPGASSASDDGEVRIAFDGDAVLFDGESQRVYDRDGLDAFHDHEASHADQPLSPGPFRPFLDGLARIQGRFGASNPIRTALVTSRGAPAHYRVINTLRDWGVTVDETYFLGGVDKAEALAAFGAHIFFDDQLVHVEAASRRVPAAQVLWPEDQIEEVEPQEPVVISLPRDPSRRRHALSQRELGLEVPSEAGSGATVTSSGATSRRR